MIDKKKDTFDPRVYLFLMLGSIISGMFLYNELSQILIFVIALIWIILALKGERVLSYIFTYAALWGITRICIYFLDLDPLNTFAIFIARFSILGRQGFPTILFALIVAKQPTGSLLGALYAMHIPKALGIGLATLLRFFPTLSEEYRHIRNAEKFRGIGVGFWHTLAHLPSVLGNVFIPLIIRITKISEELAASVTVRGVRFHNEVVSFRGIRFTKKDAIALIATIVVMTVIFVVDKTIMGVR